MYVKPIEIEAILPSKLPQGVKFDITSAMILLGNLKCVLVGDAKCTL